MNVVLPFLNPRVMDMVNANDITGLVRMLGGENQTEEDIVPLVTRELQRSIGNKEIERMSVTTMDLTDEEKQGRYQTIDQELGKLREKLLLLTERITRIEQKQCSICLGDIQDPLMLTCTHIFCGRCLMDWMISQKHKLQQQCPVCREPIRYQKLVAVVKDARVLSHREASTSEAETPEHLAGMIGRYTKEELLIRILLRKPEGRFLIFIKDEHSVSNVMRELIQNNIKWAELKGNTSTMMSVLEKFRNNSYPAILMRTQYAGSGIDLSMATDIILYNKLGTDRPQAIGRAQRVGRLTPLTIHNLCYIQEMDMDTVTQ